MSIHMVETQDNSHITVQTALMRSAWEDLQQSRRHLLAGRQSYKLDPRTDDNKVRLLSREEEKKIRPSIFQGKGIFQGQQATQQNTGSSTSSSWYRTASRGRSTERGKGKGKGKGGRGPKAQQK